MTTPDELLRPATDRFEDSLLDVLTGPEGRRADGRALAAQALELADMADARGAPETADRMRRYARAVFGN